MPITFSTAGAAPAAYPDMASASAALPQGAYTTFRTYGRNRVLRLTQHLRRLEDSLSLMRDGARFTLDDTHARALISTALADTGYRESRVRLTYDGAALFATVEAFTPYPAHAYADGVWCVTVSARRDNPHAKSTAFISSAADARKRMPPGAEEGLMIADDGSVLEGLSSNFFAISTFSAAGEELDDVQIPVLRTEEARVLIGVTRALVLEVAREVLPISTVALRQRELPRARECFITSVSREILPVVKVDDQVIGDGTPGPITRELIARFADLTAREATPL
jgi:branched-chain amino acid aminotransferase